MIIFVIAGLVFFFLIKYTVGVKADTKAVITTIKNPAIAVQPSTKANIQLPKITLASNYKVTGPRLPDLKG